MNITPRVVFWTTGDVGIGFGHVRRCLSLAEALRTRDTATTFLLDAGESVVQYVRQHGFEAIVNSGLGGSPVRSVRQAGGTAVVVDSYTVPTADLRHLQMEFFVAAIDDLADRELPVDVVVNASPARTRSDYRALSSTQYLLGPAYALLRHEFNGQLPHDRIREKVGRVLITVGGSDPNRLTLPLLQWCSTLLPGVTLDVILGPLFDDALKEEARSIAPAATYHHDPANMRGLMLQSDLAICGGGQTIYELVATGTPAVAISTALNQVVNLTAFERLGMLDWAGTTSDGRLGDRVSAAIERLAGDCNRRRRMSERGRSIVDGAGASRVASALVETFHAANQNR